MADVWQKAKPYIFLSVLQIFISIGIYLANAFENGFDFAQLIAFTTGAFVPFGNLIIASVSSFPAEIVLFIGIFTGLISAIQTYLIIEVIASHIPLVDT